MFHQIWQLYDTDAEYWTTFFVFACLMNEWMEGGIIVKGLGMWAREE